MIGLSRSSRAFFVPHAPQRHRGFGTASRPQPVAKTGPKHNGEPRRPSCTDNAHCTTLACALRSGGRFCHLVIRPLGRHFLEQRTGHFGEPFSRSASNYRFFAVVGMAASGGNATGLCLAVPIDGKNVPTTIFYKDHHTLKEIETMIRNKVG